MNIDVKNSPAISTSSEIHEICKPLFKLFSIKFFRYLKVFPDGSRIHLCNDPLWTESFYIHGLYNVSWYDANKLNINNNIETLWDEKATRQDNAVGVHAREYFNIHHGISILRPGFDCYEIFDFAAGHENHNINSIYLSNLDIFERFIFYFKDKAKEIIKLACKNKISSEDIVSKWNKEQKNIVTKDAIDDFLKETETKRYFISSFSPDTFLTKKEAEAIYWSILGKTAEEIGMITGCSNRTVEIHINNVKQKLECSKISQVIKICLNSGLLGTFRFEKDFIKKSS